MILLALATPPIDWAALAPPLALLAATGVNLLVAAFVPRGDRRVVAAYVALAGFAGALVAAAILFDQSPNGHGVIAAGQAESTSRIATSGTTTPSSAGRRSRAASGTAEPTRSCSTAEISRRMYIAASTIATAPTTA